MTRYSISTSSEDTEPVAPSISVPERFQKPRFSMESPSQFARKSAIIGKNIVKGAAALPTLAAGVPKGVGSEKESIKERMQEVATYVKDLEEKYNLTPPEAETLFERLLEGTSQGIGAGAAFGIPGAIAGGVGGLAGAAAKEVGLPESVATGIDIVASMLTPGRAFQKTTQLAAKTPTMGKSVSVIESEGLPKIRGLLKEEPGKFIKPTISKEGMQEFNRRIGNALEKKTSDIMEESLLGKQMESRGTIIGDLIGDAYDQTASLARLNKNSVDMNFVSKVIGKRAERIEKSAPSLSEATEAVVKKLRKYEKDFANKKMSADQLTPQWQEINKDLNSLYSKVELTGAEELYRKSLEEAKELILKKASKDLKDAPLMKAFQQQNELYREAAKYDKAKSLLEPAFEGEFRPAKFNQLFSSERKYSDLKKALGTANAQRLKDINRYYAQPIEQLKKKFEKNNLISLDSLITGAITKKLVGLPISLAIKITPRIQGKLLLSTNTQNAWLGLMRSIKDGSVRGVTKYSEALEKELEETSEED